jgi:hypothetical protein
METGMTKLVRDEVDPITPIRIRHQVDEIIAENGAVEECYNFIDYDFEQPGAYIRARTYVDEIESVTVYGPFDSSRSMVAVNAPELERAVLQYLERRFRRVKRRGV